MPLPVLSHLGQSFRATIICFFGLIGFINYSLGAERPNVVLILADDLGYSDLGCYGGEIDTLHLDRLARQGIRFSQFRNTARCWPTRASLLTGYYAQQVGRDKVEGVPSGTNGKRPDWAPLLPRLLQQGGYRCYHSGKWHLDGLPMKEGFDRSYELQDAGRYFGPQRHGLDGRALPAVDSGTEYYSTTAIAERAIEQLREHAAQYANRPFFSYIAFTAPHFPLQALSGDIERNLDRYRSGWDLLRHARWERIRQENLFPRETLAASSLSPPERDQGPPYLYPEAWKTLGPDEVHLPIAWPELNSAQQAFQVTKMAIHAAMVERMDLEIGRVVAQIESMGGLENTLILFLSDNGASAEMMVRDDGHDPQAAPGSARTHLSLGPGWSTLANTPFRLHKTWVHEGGIATPLIAHWPARIKTQGGIRHQAGHVIDIFPTILEIAEIPHPTRLPDQPPRPGRSLADSLRSSSLGTEPAVRSNASDNALLPSYWWNHEGNRALLSGSWKLVAARDQPWELYDLSLDRTESRNLADQYPEKVQELAAIWTSQHEAFGRDYRTAQARSHRQDER